VILKPAEIDFAGFFFASMVNLREPNIALGLLIIVVFIDEI